ncbi:phage major capsid protein [Enterococcus sp. LJL99]
MTIEELKKQAEEALENGDLEKAKGLLDEIKAKKKAESQSEELSKELNELTESTNDVEVKTDEPKPEDKPEEVADVEEAIEQEQEAAAAVIEEVDDPEEKLKKEKGEERSMKELHQGENKVKDFEAFIRSEGTERRSLDTVSGSVLVPVDVSTNVLELKDNLVDLTKYVTVEAVGTGQGKFPVAKRASAILATKEELAEIAEINDPLFIDVEYKCATRIGQIAFSNELLEDSEIDVVAYAEKQMQRMVRNTNNKGVLDVLAGFGNKTVTDVDGLKSIVNVELDPELDIKVVVNQDAYQYLDTLKDSQGRYLLQDSIAVDSGKVLFGKEVIVVSNKVAKTPAKSVGYIFMGDLAESVFMAKRKDITAEWEKFDRYSKGLAVGIRSDYKEIDKEAGYNVLVTAPAAG